MKTDSTLLAILMALTLSAAGTIRLPARADSTAQLYDWTVRIQTQRLDRQFNYGNSKLRNLIDRLDVDYYTGDDEGNNKAYESLWYFDGKPLGLERFGPFDIPKAEGICIKVEHAKTSPTREECKDAANMILRMLLEAHVNQSAVITIKVPQQTFDQVVAQLQIQGCSPAPQLAPDQAEDGASLKLFLEAYDGGNNKGQTVTLQYM